MDNIQRGREYVAQLAEAEGESLFAQQVREGAWDHRNDVAEAISGNFFKPRRLKKCSPTEP